MCKRLPETAESGYHSWSSCGFAVVQPLRLAPPGRRLEAPAAQSRGLTRDFNRTMKYIFKGAAATPGTGSGGTEVPASVGRIPVPADRDERPATVLLEPREIHVGRPLFPQLLAQGGGGRGVLREL